MTSIRDVETRDFATILQLNRVWEHVTSPLDDGALAALHEQAAYHRAAEIDGRVVGFLLALAPGANYESPNYLWFDRSVGDFLYIDRVVVDSASQGSGVGALLYADVLAYARARGMGRLVCEVDIEPLNVSSDAFHKRLGFVEVGTQYVGDGRKRVSLRERVIT